MLPVRVRPLARDKQQRLRHRLSVYILLYTRDYYRGLAVLDRCLASVVDYS